MYRLSEILTDDNLCDLRNVDETFVYYRYPFKLDTIPIPLIDIDDDFVIPLNYILLPFQETEQITYQNGKQTKWSLVKTVFANQIQNIFQLDKAIKTYNPSLQRLHFDILTNYVHYQMDDDERRMFFDQILPGIIRLALDLPRLIGFNLANLEQYTPMTIFLSQQQISSLLANAFLCTYRPDFNRKERRCINFSSLFASDGCKPNKKFCKQEKLKCLFNYLRRVVEKTPIGVVSFERKVLRHHQQTDLEQSTKPITTFEFNHDRCLLKDGCDYSQVDFAHKYIGGGVLDQGCVQEEILFVCCPELIVSKLICAKLTDNEAIVITGIEQYNEYSGYAEKFRWQCSYEDKQHRDKYGRRFRQVLAMDALYFHWSAKKSQYEKEKIDREIHKAMAAFQPERFLCSQSKLVTITTGNWGCGVYNGDVKLKTLIQIIAASESKRNLMYFTFDNRRLKNEFDQIKTLFETSEQPFTVGRLYRLLLQYASQNKMKTKILI
ncbi:hypothetical protein HUG17_7919 [Dermatophagoides farinae]|uniref:poly(ADP-ribose) glycohydrolase n=1 Tax=Dermatophagoides farinae TaxID=6954 RepID=A0A9D4NYU1_DERFA|nr:poly(ADP-ribose) glycohydrolase 1-like [Dermatophagoides farinae]KAH7640452.1 hypothetical protein HUG17_7919 [Dermatophagoides farinae]